MNNRSRIYESVQMIENNLRNGLSVTDVAEEIGFSYYYFSHLFKAVTGISPSVYMSQRKLAHSVELLMTTDMKVIDIALVFGYGSPEAYSRAFTKCFGQTPMEVRKQGLKHGGKMMKPLEENQTLNGMVQPFRQPELMELSELHLAGIAFYHDFETDKNDLSEQWTNLMEHLDMIEGIKEPSAFYQMQMWFPKQSTKSIYFFVAVGVEALCKIPIQMTLKTVPAQHYLRFYHKGLANQVGETYRYIYEEWLPRTDYKLSSHYNFEYYGEENLGPYNPASVTEIYIPIEHG